MAYQKQNPTKPIKDWGLQEWNETELEMDYFRKKNQRKFSSIKMALKLLQHIILKV